MSKISCKKSIIESAKCLIKRMIPFYMAYKKSKSTTISNQTFLGFVRFKLTGRCDNYGGYYPVHPNCTIANMRKIYVGINSSVARSGCYLQGAGTIRVGDYVRFAPNVGVLSANHDLYDHRKYNVAPIVIGDYSWIGMNSVITAGVTLGTRTIVAAGAVVTKSFPDGFCVLAGVPAKVVKYLDKDKFVPWHSDYEYYGYIPKDKFEPVRKKYLDIEL